MRHRVEPDRATEADGDGAGSGEVHGLAMVGVATGDGGRREPLAMLARWARQGVGGPAAFQCVVFRPGRLPVVLAVDGLVGPPGRWEFRSSGLWVELVCEQPGLHWSLGLEAFALAVDNPTELLGRGYGERVALGWELDVVATPETLRGAAGVRDQAGSVEGLVLTTPDPLRGDGPSPELAFEGRAVRRHDWRTGSATGASDPVDALALVGEAGTGTDGGLGSPGEVAVPLEHSAVWWVGHDGERLTSRVEPPPASSS